MVRTHVEDALTLNSVICPYARHTHTHVHAESLILVYVYTLKYCSYECYHCY